MTNNKSASLILLTSLLNIIGSIIATFMFPILEDFLPLFVVIIIILTGMGLLLYSMVDKINEEQIRLEKEIKKVGKGVERAENLVGIKAESKYLKDKIFKIEEMIKNGS